ncbi:MAG: S9 family peptidase, partial [Bacteroidota bacterium]
MRVIICLVSLMLSVPFLMAQKAKFSYLDVFDLQYVSDPQISPDGEWVVYRRMGFDIMKDRSVGNLWLIKSDGSQHQKMTAREVNESSARWSPTGDRIVFSSSTENG